MLEFKVYVKDIRYGKVTAKFMPMVKDSLVHSNDKVKSMVAKCMPDFLVNTTIKDILACMPQEQKMIWQLEQR